jgi:hypothetical protein
MEHRNCVSATVQDLGDGIVEAVFATLNVVDLDGDIMVPGAIGNQDVIVSAYNHATWKGALPVAKGRVREVGNEAVATRTRQDLRVAPEAGVRGTMKATPLR